MELSGEFAMSLQAENVTKKYRPIVEIGSGGMSRVHLAVASGPGGVQKFHVIKNLLPSLADDPEFLNMFLEEARLSARLNHPNVVQINEVGFDGEHHFMAMEYLEGQSLETVVRWAARRGGLPFGLYARVLVDAAQGLHYAHELCDYDGTPLGVVHRDISPHNIFVTYQGQVKVLDFGIAKAADSAQQTRTGMLKGKVEYMAPERFRPGSETNRRADVFALGVMLWQATAQRRIWDGLSHIEVFQRLSAGEIPTIRSVAPQTPEGLARICEHALEPDPARRCPTAAAFAEELEAYLIETRQEIRPRELAAYVSEAFAERRAQTRGIIESALQRPSTSIERSAVPISVSNLPTLTESPLREMPDPLSMALGGNLPAPSVTYPSNRPLSISGTVAGPTLVSQRVGGTPNAKPAWPWVVGVGAALAVVGAAAFALRRDESTNPTGPQVASSVSATTPLVASATSPLPPVSSLTRVLAAASPSQAQLFVDEVPLSSNPAAASFTRDGQLHRVRAEAPGYRGETKVIAYDAEEQVITLNLRREAASAPVPVARPRDPTPAKPPPSPPPPSAAPPPPPPPPTAKPKPSAPQLDRESPW
jgi:serine/threonine-protein kinase